VRLYVYGGIATLLMGLSAWAGYRAAPKGKDKIVTKRDVVTETNTVVKTEWRTKDGTVITKVEEGQTKIVEKLVKEKPLPIPRPNTWELGILRQVGSNGYEAFGSYRLGQSPFKIISVTTINTHPSVAIGVSVSF